MKSKTIIPILLILLSMLFQNCEDSNDPIIVNDEIGVIKPGVGINGVKIGDSRETVMEKLGLPSRIYQETLFDRDLRLLQYKRGENRGLNIYYCVEDGFFRTVDYIVVDTNYIGCTEDSIRTRLTFDQVHEIYDTPDNYMEKPKDEDNEGIIKEIYCFGKSHFEIEYHDSIAIYLKIGTYKQIENDPWYEPCK